MRIEEIDKNFKPVMLGDRPVVFLNAFKRPFCLEGFPWRADDDAPLYRLPVELTKADVNEGALALSRHTTGGTVRFRTDSRFVAIKAKLSDSFDMNHMPRAGSAGFDIYKGSMRVSCHVGTGQPNRDEVDFQRMLFLRKDNDVGMEEWCINLPLYGGAVSIEIGLTPDCAIEPPTPHANAPILFYGSSITQGGCASRPGNNYCSMLCRDVDAEQVNLGFSGSGRGEIAIAHAIAGLKNLGVFVFDYDHNAPDAAYLASTHEPFFKAVREKKPNLPIIFMSMCNFWPERNDDIAIARRAIIRATYDKAVALGDRHVYFIDGETLFNGLHRDACTVDTAHPNDLGFYRMYETVLPVLKRAISEATANA